MKGVKRFDGVPAARILGQEEGWDRKNSGEERQQGEATPVGPQCPWLGEYRVKAGEAPLRGSPAQGALPGSEEFGASADGVGPGVGIGADMVAVAHAEFGADPQLVAGAGAGQPAGEKILGEHEVIAELRGERAATVGDGDLAMLAVERAQVEHLRVLDELRPDEQASGIIGRQHVL